MGGPIDQPSGGVQSLKYMEITKLELIDGIWMGTEINMTTKKGKQALHKTILKANNVAFNQEISDEQFTIRRLEKGL